MTLTNRSVSSSARRTGYVEIRITGSARGAAKFLADAIATARRVGAGTVIRCRLDSAFDKVVAAIRHAKAQFSITARMDKAVQKAISLSGAEISGVVSRN